MKSLSDQIRDLENTRAAKAAELSAVVEKATEEGRTMDAAEAETFDELETVIKQIDSDLVRFNKLLKMQAETAAPVTDGKSVESASTARGKGSVAPTIITRRSDRDDDFEGQAFTRLVIAKMAGKFLDVNPANFAERRWGKSNPNLVQHIKAAVAGHQSDSGAGSELVDNNVYTGDFINFLYAQTVYNQLPLRVVPANITIKGQDGAATGYWVGESKSIPVSQADFSTVNLSPLKVAGMAVMSKEWVRDSSPSGERLIRDALVEALAQVIDTKFFSTDAASAGVSPAGILNGTPVSASAGTDSDAVLNDIKELRKRFIDAKNSGGLAWVMNPNLASSLGLMRNALGQREFTEINQTGGRLEGDPVYVGDNINANHLILLKPSDIYRIEAGNLEVSMSEHATIEMADDPAGDSDTPTAQANQPVSMYQTESIAVKAVMPMNFQKRRTSAIAYINDADYGGAVST